MATEAQKKEILKHITRDELAGLTKELVDIPSPTGHEREIGTFILDWFKDRGLKPIAQEISADRINAVGILEGSGGGTSLMINGHMDTSFTGTDEDAVLCRELDPVEDLRGAIDGGTVYGLGASNMKCGLAAFMTAGKALRQAGIQLKGDLILAAVAGEISRTPIGPYQSEDYRGEGTGTRHLLTHGVQSDYAIVADGSALSVIWAQTGVAQFKISTFGSPRSAWGKTRADAPPRESNAVLKMVDVVRAVDDWAEAFERETVYRSANGPILSKVNVGAIRGGAPYRPNYYPGICDLYVDVRMPPETTPMDVQRQLKAVLAGLDVETELEMYGSLLGHEAEGIEPVAEVLEATHQALYGEKTPEVTPGRSSIWTDTNIYNEMGIPACKFGPRGERWKMRSEQVEVEEIFRAAQVFALAAATICDWER
ncbi:MAG: M20/M25/M40 family metallo-hydrolase [Alphaproteobacteria bacterium]|nr:M20/M25/M40 family metallo-hydrolase [Alphaproteobacteria bacterium]